MADQATVSVTSSWAAAKAGPADINLHNSGGNPIFYRVAASAPAANIQGVTLEARQTHPVKAATGQSVWVRKATTGTVDESVEVVDA